MNIYVGNLDYKLKESDLQKAFEEFGDVKSAKIITDKETGRNKGFAFVEMASDDDAKRAINELNGVEFGSRKIIVNEAKPRTERV